MEFQLCYASVVVSTQRIIYTVLHELIHSSSEYIGSRSNACVSPMNIEIFRPPKRLITISYLLCFWVFFGFQICILVIFCVSMLSIFIEKKKYKYKYMYKKKMRRVYIYIYMRKHIYKRNNGKLCWRRRSSCNYVSPHMCKISLMARRRRRRNKTKQ